MEGEQKDMIPPSLPPFPPLSQVVVDGGVIPLLVPLLAHMDNKVVVSETDCHIQMSHLTTLFPPPPCCLTKFPTLRALGNIVKGTEAQTQAVLDGGILPHLHKLMEHSHPTIAQVSHVRASGIVGS